MKIIMKFNEGWMNEKWKSNNVCDRSYCHWLRYIAADKTDITTTFHAFCFELLTS